MPGFISTRFKKGFNSTKAINQLNRRVPIIINDAVGIIKKDVTDGLIKGIDINSKPFVELKPATVKAKRRAKYKHPTRALWAKGIMQNTYFRRRAKVNNPVAILRIAESRVDPEIGKFHQKGMGNNPKREWFGMGPRALALIQKMLKLNVSRVLDDEFHIR